jgi:DNA polymerase-4
MEFNPKHSTRMHIDLNSCFASVEQQANPFLRGKPMGVGAYETPNGCIIAPSREAKQLGIKTGMRVMDGKLISPNLVIIQSDPAKYRTIHLRLKRLLLEYTDHIEPKSIDEFVLDLEGTPSFKKGMLNVAKEIKKRILDEIGDFLTVNVGVAPNRFLAKTAAGLRKPDGLDEINISNYLQIYSKLGLTDLCGIEKKYAARLSQFGIFTVLDFYNADAKTLKYAFRSKIGYDWYLRLRGWEIDDVTFPRRSFGNSFALGTNLATPEQLAPILMKLVDKTGWRMRKQGYKANGIHLSLSFRSGNFWHRGMKLGKTLFDSRDIYKELFKMLHYCPYREPVRILAESVFDLEAIENAQLELFDDVDKKAKVVEAIDSVKEKYGSFSIMPGIMLGTEDIMPDRVSFGGVSELLEYTTEDNIDDISNFSDDIYPDLEQGANYVW